MFPVKYRLRSVERTFVSHQVFTFQDCPEALGKIKREFVDLLSWRLRYTEITIENLRGRARACPFIRMLRFEDVIFPLAFRERIALTRVPRAEFLVELHCTRSRRTFLSIVPPKRVLFAPRNAIEQRRSRSRNDACVTRTAKFSIQLYPQNILHGTAWIDIFIEFDACTSFHRKRNAPLKTDRHARNFFHIKTMIHFSRRSHSELFRIEITKLSVNKGIRKRKQKF